ncbi:glycosyltransferase family 2 protein [Candidatus Uhrbacteria bacterium]|nr:glycosyltransferase family 2 protein [Candidatus Uhrbacteria bacterium]
MDVQPLISIVIPCRNEERFIAACLDSLLAQTYPKTQTEIIVIDGASADGTVEIIKNYLGTAAPSIRLLHNEKRYKPFSLNIGIREAHGDVIMIADAHASFSKNYLDRCVQLMYEYDSQVVGGIRKAVASVSTAQARAITNIFSHPLGVGNATYQLGTRKPQWVDAVFGGCYRKELFDEVGLFNENLIRSQDMEMSIRLRRAGKKILLAPDITCTYYPKATLKEFCHHNIADGIWAIYPLKFVRVPLRLRHYVPLGFMISLITLGVSGLFLPLVGIIFTSSLIVYMTIILLISVELAQEKRDIRLFPFLAAAFMARHFGYGIGSMIGVWKLLLPNKQP